jgi:hypothetical protein
MLFSQRPTEECPPLTIFGPQRVASYLVLSLKIVRDGILWRALASQIATWMGGKSEIRNPKLLASGWVPRIAVRPHNRKALGWADGNS